MTTITSLKNSRVKEAARLREGRHRRRTGRIVIDGARELVRALDAGIVPLEIFLCEESCVPEVKRELFTRLADRRVDVLRVDKAVFEKLAFGARSEGVLAVAATPETPLARIPTAGRPVVAVLEHVEKPGNLGAVLRSADGAGIAGLIAADPATDLFNPNAIRASLGTLFSVPVATATSAETLNWLRKHGFAIHAARVDGSVPYTQADLRGPAAIVLGSEADGLSDTWRGEDVQAIRLPMQGIADSLNVSVSAAVLFYESLRQRSDAGP